MVSDHEKAISARLRAFRESLQIPRAKFAVTIGFGSERLASIESGRAPLRYEVFQAVSMHYHISPHWLFSGEGSPLAAAQIHAVSPDVYPRSLFSEVYRKHLSGTKETGHEVQNFMAECVRSMDELFDLECRGKIPPSIMESYLNLLDAMSEHSSDGTRSSAALREGFKLTLRKLRAARKRMLTETESESRSKDVKPILPGLLARLRKATEEPGKKSELAKFLNAPLASVSRWLSPDPKVQREPGGEIALKMLHWVEAQERKQ